MPSYTVLAMLLFIFPQLNSFPQNTSNWSTIMSRETVLLKLLSMPHRQFIYSLFTVWFLVLATLPGSAQSAEHMGYHIGPGDILEISVWKEESLSREVIVPPDRIITFPLIGDINIATMTVTDLRKEISKRL